jgi:hypothetical protein
MYNIPNIFNYRIIYKYNIYNILTISEMVNIIYINYYPIIMTLNIDNTDNDLLNDNIVEIIYD